MQESHHIAQKNLIQFKEKQSKNQNRVYQENITENDLILLKKENRKNKLDPIWEGPYEVKQLKFPNIIIQRVGKRKCSEVHLNRVKLFHCPQENQDEVTSSLDSPE